MIFAVMLCHLSRSERKTLKIPGLNGSNPDLSLASAVLHLLSYQANRKLVIMWVYDAPVDNGY